MKTEINTPFGFQCLNIDGQAVLISDEDVAWVKQTNWCIIPVGYVQKTGHNGERALHRIIAKPKLGKEVDHKNRIKLDNRRENLRSCTRSQNKQNCNLRPDNNTSATGVWRRSNGNYVAEIWLNGKKIYLGSFGTLAGAIRTRKAAEKRMGWNEF